MYLWRHRCGQDRGRGLKKTNEQRTLQHRHITHLIVHKLDEREAPTSQSDLVLDQQDTPHTLCAFLSNARRILHRLRNRLWPGEGIETAEQQDRCLRVTDIPSAIVGVERTAPPVRRTGALRKVDLHPPAVMWHTRFQRLVECCRGGRTV